MHEHITPFRLANSILQDSSHDGSHLLVEGDTDIKLYKKFTCEESSRIKICFGKHKMRETYALLRERGFNKVIGIRDADFLRLNGKMDDNYQDKIFVTDHHDSEGMMFLSKAFNNVLSEVVREDILNKYIENNGDIREKIYNLTYPIACLRYANKIHHLGLSFKPATTNGNELKFKKFICDQKYCYLGHEKLVNTVYEYSKNRGSIVSPREKILEMLFDIEKRELSITELVNGHDLAEVIFILCKKILKSTHPELNSRKSIESMLRLAYDNVEFSKTELYKSLKNWQEETKYPLLSA